MLRWAQQHCKKHYIKYYIKNLVPINNYQIARFSTIKLFWLFSPPLPSCGGQAHHVISND